MVEWHTSSGLTEYASALEQMQQRVADIHTGIADEMVWLLEHPPLYTAGTSAKGTDLLDKRFPVYEAGRGGEYTYHGPGQRIAYVMLDLNKRGRDIRAYVKQLEKWIILTLAEFGVDGFTRERRIGVWVNVSPTVCRSVTERSNGMTAFAGSWQPCPLEEGAQERDPALSHAPSRRSVDRSGGQQQNEKKIAALGIRVRKWVSFHGIAINVAPDLSHYSGIVPCGISEYGVTSLADLGIDTSLESIDAALKKQFQSLFDKEICG